ncbi:hypothetical protein Tco_0790803 [Tanacetum coccineum]
MLTHLGEFCHRRGTCARVGNSPRSEFYLCHILFQPPFAVTNFRRRKRGRHQESSSETRLLSETAATISTVCHTLRAVWIRGVTDLNWTQNRIDVEPIGQTGKDAASRDLLATITGFSRAVAAARQKAKIHQNRKWAEKDATRMLCSRRGTKVMVLARISNTSEPPATLHILGMIVIETLKYLTSERGIMVKALDAIISDASPRYDCLEIAYLRTIIYTAEHVVGQGSFGINDKNELYLNLVLEYVPDTPYRVTRHCSKANQRMPMIYVKLYTYQFTSPMHHSFPDHTYTATEFNSHTLIFISMAGWSGGGKLT